MLSHEKFEFKRYYQIQKSHIFKIPKECAYKSLISRVQYSIRNLTEDLNSYLWIRASKQASLCTAKTEILYCKQVNFFMKSTIVWRARLRM